MVAHRGTTTRLRRETKGGRKANKAKSRGVGGVLIKERRGKKESKRKCEALAGV